MSIDLNADVGEGCDDEALLPFLTSANVACVAGADLPLLAQARPGQRIRFERASLADALAAWRAR